MKRNFYTMYLLKLVPFITSVLIYRYLVRRHVWVCLLYSISYTISVQYSNQRCLVSDVVEGFASGQWQTPFIEYQIAQEASQLLCLSHARVSVQSQINTCSLDVQYVKIYNEDSEYSHIGLCIEAKNTRLHPLSTRP